MTLKHLLPLLFVLAFSGCSILKPATPKSVTLGDNAKFSYSGRGSGAGIALMSTMGPVGIAVGVAIDEGIRKDLENSASTHGFNILKIIKQSDIKAEHIVVLDYGMKDVPGSDFLYPYLILKTNSEANENILELDYSNIQNTDSTPYNLEQYRENGQLIIENFYQLIELRT